LDDKLSSTLFGQTRRAVLAVLYGHPDEAFYLRQIIHATQAGPGAVQRELKVLSDAGIIRRETRGRQVYYQADPQCPVFAELKTLVTKTAGAGDHLRAALAPLRERIRSAFIYGSVARNQERSGSDVDLMVIGDVAFSEVVSALAPAQEVLRREVNPTVYSSLEFQAKLKGGHHFVVDVLRQNKVFLIGSEHELEQLGQERMAGRPSKQPQRNSKVTGTRRS
jgi:predicted nucleotidyltransferase